MKIHREKDKIREIENGRGEVRPCECGGIFSLKSIREHEKSKRHQNYLISQYPAGIKADPW